jgi:hypothetical protein
MINPELQAVVNSVRRAVYVKEAIIKNINK